MKFELTGRLPDGRFGIKATPQEYDGVPVIDTLTFDREPLFLHDDLVSVASILAFGEYCSGSLSLPRRTSPEVVKAIEEYLNPIWVSVSPVEFEPRANPQGDGVLLMENNLRRFGEFRSEWGRPRNSTLCIVPASQFGGAIASADGLIMASNAAIMGSFATSATSTNAELAVALLFAETFRAGTILLGPSYNIDDYQFNRLYKLLFSCKISLSRI